MLPDTVRTSKTRDAPPPPRQHLKLVGGRALKLPNEHATRAQVLLSKERRGGSEAPRQRRRPTSLRRLRLPATALSLSRCARHLLSESATAEASTLRSCSAMPDRVPKKGAMAPTKKNRARGVEEEKHLVLEMYPCLGLHEGADMGTSQGLQQRGRRASSLSSRRCRRRKPALKAYKPRKGASNARLPCYEQNEQT